MCTGLIRKNYAHSFNPHFIKIICETIAQERKAKSSLIIITHYPRILNYFQPTHVHVLIDGKIRKSGHLELVEKIEKDGYDSFSEDKRK